MSQNSLIKVVPATAIGASLLGIVTTIATARSVPKLVMALTDLGLSTTIYAADMLIVAGKALMAREPRPRVVHYEGGRDSLH